jgi:hypothetical protein
MDNHAIRGLRIDNSLFCIDHDLLYSFQSKKKDRHSPLIDVTFASFVDCGRPRRAGVASPIRRGESDARGGQRSTHSLDFFSELVSLVRRLLEYAHSISQSRRTLDLLRECMSLSIAIPIPNPIDGATHLVGGPGCMLALAPAPASPGTPTAFAIRTSCTESRVS